jgi:hypothetical protein
MRIINNAAETEGDVDLNRGDFWRHDWAAERVDLPLEAIPDCCRHGKIALLTRHFNRPSNLEPSQQVLLTIGPLALAKRILLNRQELTKAEVQDEARSAVWAVGSLLERYNRLDLIVDHIDCLSTADVRLLIHGEPAAGERGASAP